MWFAFFCFGRGWKTLFFIKMKWPESLVFQGFWLFLGTCGAVLERDCFFVGKKRINIMHDVFALEKRKILDFLFLRSIMYFNKAQHNRVCVRK